MPGRMVDLAGVRADEGGNVGAGLAHGGVRFAPCPVSISPHVAAYFAVRGSDETAGRLWAFDEPKYEVSGRQQWRDWPETTALRQRREPGQHCPRGGDFGRNPASGAARRHAAALSLTCVGRAVQSPLSPSWRRRRATANNHSPTTQADEERRDVASHTELPLLSTRKSTSSKRRDTGLYDVSRLRKWTLCRPSPPAADTIPMRPRTQVFVSYATASRA